MTVREAAEGVFTRHHGTYNIGFTNGRGMDDETQFDGVGSIRELEGLFAGFCEENGYGRDTVLYVERA